MKIIVSKDKVQSLLTALAGKEYQESAAVLEQTFGVKSDVIPTELPAVVKYTHMKNIQIVEVTNGDETLIELTIDDSMIDILADTLTNNYNIFTRCVQALGLIRDILKPLFKVMETTMDLNTSRWKNFLYQEKELTK